MAGRPYIDLRRQGTLCPEGKHQIYAAVEAAPALVGLEAGTRARVIQMLCQIAEVAALAPNASQYWDESQPLRLTLGGAEVLYSIDPIGGVVVQRIAHEQVA